MGKLTKIDIRVMAVGGKFLGDDIGGALVTIHDQQTGELLAKGITQGGSGSDDLMTIKIDRSDVWPVQDASIFSAELDLEEPRLLTIKAYGPIAMPQAANTTIINQWVYPGKNLTGGKKGGGLYLQIPGLAVQLLNPPTHFKPAVAPEFLDLKANVTMMCGCPIGAKGTTWPCDQFAVEARIKKVGGEAQKLIMKFDDKAPFGAPSQFQGLWHVPKNHGKDPAIYQITVSAYQQQTANTGIDYSTLIIPPGIP